MFVSFVELSYGQHRFVTAVQHGTSSHHFQEVRRSNGFA
jgi:hypothetical protein